MYYINKGYGAVLYFTKLEDTNVDGKVLSIPGLRDRAYIQIGNVLVGVLDRTKSTELKINLPDNDDLALVILVENNGRTDPARERVSERASEPSSSTKGPPYDTVAISAHRGVK